MKLGPWECFQDESYYNMWCVRRVHDRVFGHGFHLANGHDAAALRDFLNAQPELLEALEECAVELRIMSEWVHEPLASEYAAKHKRALTAIAKARSGGGV